MRKSLYTDERGFGQVMVIVLVVAVIAIAGGIGWRVSQNNKKPAAAKTTVGKAINTACLKVYNDKTLCYAAAASSNFEKLAYTAVATNVDAQGQTSKLSLQSDGKGNSSFATESSGQSYNTVMIGSTVYVKNAGSSTWVKYSSGTNASTTNPTSDLKTEFSDTSTPVEKRIQYKKLGTEKCGHLTCVKYQVIDPATPGTTNYVWFDTKDYRLQRWYGKDANSTNDFVITYTSVKITTPSPVATQADAGMPTQAQIQALQEQAQAAASQYAQ
jgi:hypothetical protein